MRYTYRGIEVESGRRLDSTVFRSVTAEKAEKPIADSAKKAVKKPERKPSATGRR